MTASTRRPSHLERVPPGMLLGKQAVIPGELISTVASLQATQPPVHRVPANPPPTVTAIGRDDECGMHVLVASSQLASDGILRGRLDETIQSTKNHQLRRRKNGRHGAPRPQPSRRRTALSYHHRAHPLSMTER